MVGTPCANEHTRSPGGSITHQALSTPALEEGTLAEDARQHDTLTESGVHHLIAPTPIKRQIGSGQASQATKTSAVQIHYLAVAGFYLEPIPPTPELSSQA